MLATPPLARGYINAATNVKWMQSTYAGVDAQCGGLRKDVRRISRRLRPAAAEYAFAYILAFRKELAENLAYQKNHEWKQMRE